MSERVIHLGLQLPSSRPVQDVMRDVLRRTLALLADALTTDDSAADTQVREAVAQCVAALPHADAAHLAVLGETCLALCQQALERTKAEQTTRRSELSALVGLMREAVAALTSSGQAFSGELTAATQRFSTLARLDNLTDIKRQLTSEVTALKGLIAARQQALDTQGQVFQQQLATLQAQLAVARIDAGHDPLTGLANRREFDDCLRGRLSGANSFIVALLDLDHFKTINDTHGHQAGDRVLTAVADALKTAMRTDDMVARVGGDEFALVAQGMAIDQAERRLRGMLASLAALRIPAGDLEISLTLSCGIAEYSAGDTAASLYKRADEALYDAKRQGKNRVAMRRTQLIRDLRRG